MIQAIAGLAAIVLAAVAWQHFRYLRRRRNFVQDRQPLFHRSSAFHVVTVARLAPGADLLADTRRLVAALRDAGARIVYVGKAIPGGLSSKQVVSDPFDVALFCQYPSREAYEKARLRAEVMEARAAFASTYDQGMQRSAPANLMIPIALLARRFADILRRRPARYPFERGDELPEAIGHAPEERTRLVEALRKEQELGRDAVLVVNFIQRGTREQQEQDAAYGHEMMGLMAEQGHGPMHMGRAVTVEGDARFDVVVLVFYPGVDYFADMLESRFFGSIVGGKQLGDTLSRVTVPLLDRL